MFLGGYQPEGGIAAPESREYLMSEQGLRRACEEGIILEAVAVRCDLSFRLTVDLHCMNGYIEREDVQFSPTGEPVRDIAVITRGGKAVCFRVTGFFTENGKTAARLSRREAQRECAEKYLAALEPGDIIDAKVTHLENFGAFVELETGETGLVHISEIADTFVKDIHDHLTVNDEVKVKILNINDNGKIGLSIKQAKERKKPQKPSPSFEDKIARFMKDSDEKLASFNKNMNAKRRSGNRY